MNLYKKFTVNLIICKKINRIKILVNLINLINKIIMTKDSKILLDNINKMNKHINKCIMKK